MPNISKALRTLGADGGTVVASKWFRAEAAVIEGHPAKVLLPRLGCEAAIPITFAPCIAEGIAFTFAEKVGIPCPDHPFPDMLGGGAFAEKPKGEKIP